MVSRVRSVTLAVMSDGIIQICWPLAASAMMSTTRHALLAGALSRTKDPACWFNLSISCVIVSGLKASNVRS